MERWKKEVEHFNAVYTNPERQIDPKKDKSPGPAHYSLISGWQFKDDKGASEAPKKKGKFKEQKLPNIFKKFTHGPKINMYYKST